MPKKNYPIDYDNNWKEVVTAMIEDFIAFFMPRLYADIDFEKPIEFLEQELYDVLQAVDKDKVLDKLVRVNLKNGEDKWIFIHIEFQTKAEKDFSKRMYHYYRLIRSKYEKDVTALVIYTGKYKPRLYDHYKEENYGTSILYRFNAYRVIKQNEAELLENQNPFAIVVLANYYVLKTTATDKQRLTFKEHLFELARMRDYSEEKTQRLFFFINELMRLASPFNQEFKNHILQLYNFQPIMRKYSQDTLDIVDIYTENAYGTTIPAVQKKLKKAVVHLYKKLKMSIDEIAEFMDEEPKVIHDMLMAEKVIKG